MVHDTVLQTPSRGSWGLFTFDLDSVADLLPALQVTVFYFLGSEYNDSSFHR